MQIEEQIKKLQRIKAKIDLYRKVQGNVQDELVSVNQDSEHKSLEAEYPGLLSEFCSEIDAFCNKRVEQLGNPTAHVPVAESPAEVSRPRPQEQPKPAVHQVAMIDDEPTDPLRFLMKHKALDGKRVSFQSKDGLVQGTVRGLVTPFIKVETDSGFVIDVKPKELSVI